MEIIEALLKSRVSRTQLDTTKSYTRIRTVGGKEERTFVGTFVRTYTTGSGDGMTSNLEFNNNGSITTISEDMWGSVNGDELSCFIESS